jgi:hypothetical protein
MEAGKFSFKFSRQTQKNLVGSSKYAYFSDVAQLIVLESKGTRTTCFTTLLNELCSELSTSTTKTSVTSLEFRMYEK